jgi:hypothetical protein
MHRIRKKLLTGSVCDGAAACHGAAVEEHRHVLDVIITTLNKMSMTFSTHISTSSYQHFTSVTAKMILRFTTIELHSML